MVAVDASCQKRPNRLNQHMDESFKLRAGGMVVVAHPDDETIGASFLLQRQYIQHAVFCTSGAPDSPREWGIFDSKESYAHAREAEALAALAVVSPSIRSTFFRLPDGKLHNTFHSLCRLLFALFREYPPSFVVTHACEGGHPDHDSCALAVTMTARQLGIDCLEMPLYGRNGSRFLRQALRESVPPAALLLPARGETTMKIVMLKQYQTQETVLASFDPTCPESFGEVDEERSVCFLRDAGKYVVSSLKGKHIIEAFERFKKEFGEGERVSGS